MRVHEMIMCVDNYLDCRGLADPRIRKNAIRKVAEFIKSTDIYLKNGHLNLPVDKDSFKDAYCRYKQIALNGAEKSAINHMYDIINGKISNNTANNAIQSSDIDSPRYDFNKVQTKSRKQADQNTISKHNSMVNIEDKVLQFIKIDPKHQDLNSISHQNGIYIFTLSEGCDIPDTQNKPEYELYEGQRVLYIGQTKSGLNSRINKTHFNGRAGSSTLRKSLGCLLGYKLIPRSKKNPNDGKTTFEKCDEIKLSQWMRDNLIVYYAIVLDDIDSAENKLINSYSPPLNLSKVPMDRNQGFRSELSSLRSMK
ncbi:MAG: hypothetical protein IJA96_00225 [Alistipes sp.]|nr:hypothetical protein [Alistipes sp.]